MRALPWISRAIGGGVRARGQGDAALDKAGRRLYFGLQSYLENANDGPRHARARRSSPMSASLSESGARAPLNGGRFTAWWGFLRRHRLCRAASRAEGRSRVGAGGGIFGDHLVRLRHPRHDRPISSSPARCRPRPAPARPAIGPSRTVWAAGALSIGSMVIGSRRARPIRGHDRMRCSIGSCRSPSPSMPAR